MEQNMMAVDTLSLMYGAAASYCRNDQDALQVLTGTTLPRKVLWESVVVMAAHMVKAQGWDVGSVGLILDGVDPSVAQKVMAAASDWNQRDREGVHLALIGLTKSGWDPVVVGASIIGRLWTAAATERGVDPVDYAKRLCLAAGFVTASL